MPATSSGLKNSCRLVCWPSWFSAEAKGWAWIWMVLPASAAWLLTATALTARASARARKRGKGLLFTSSKLPGIRNKRQPHANGNAWQLQLAGKTNERKKT
ncbi:hypothetical protein D3C75_1074010 [compost metagenome]